MLVSVDQKQIIGKQYFNSLNDIEGWLKQSYKGS